MRLSLFFLSLLSVGSSLLVEPRQESRGLAAKVITKIIDLKKSVNNFSGSPSGLIPQTLAVLKAETRLNITILKATHITARSPHLHRREEYQYRKHVGW